MSEQYIQLPPDSSGKKVRSIERTIGSDIVYSEVMSIVDSNGTVISPLKEGGTVVTTAVIGTIEVVQSATIDILKSGTITITNPVNTVTVSNTVPVTGEFTISTIDLLKDGSITVLNPVNTVEISNPVETVIVSSATLAANQWISVTSGTIGNTVSVKLTQAGTVNIASGTIDLVTSATIGNTVNVNSQPGMEVHCANINVGNSTVAVVSAVASKMIKVYSILMTANGACTITWRSNGTAISGTIFADAIGWGYSQVSDPPAYLLATAAGATLNLACLGATIGGYLSYWDDDIA